MCPMQLSTLYSCSLEGCSRAPSGSLSTPVLRPIRMAHVMSCTTPHLYFAVDPIYTGLRACLLDVQRQDLEPDPARLLSWEVMSRGDLRGHCSSCRRGLLEERGRQGKAEPGECGLWDMRQCILELFCSVLAFERLLFLPWFYALHLWLPYFRYLHKDCQT